MITRIHQPAVIFARPANLDGNAPRRSTRTQIVQMGQELPDVPPHLQAARIVALTAVPASPFAQRPSAAPSDRPGGQEAYPDWGAGRVLSCQVDDSGRTHGEWCP